MRGKRRSGFDRRSSDGMELFVSLVIALLKKSWCYSLLKVRLCTDSRIDVSS